MIGPPSIVRNRVLAVACAAMLLCGGRARAADVHAADFARGLTPLSGQTRDGVIARDLAAIDAWGTRLDSLPEASDDVWRSTSARGWLRAARAEYTDNDRQGFPQAAFARAVTLITEMEKHAAIPSNEFAPPEVAMTGSVRVGDSLYATLWTLKHHPGFRCAMEELANLEVELSWAGNEQLDQGDCRTSPHLASAIDWAAKARAKANDCFATPVAAQPEPEVPTPAVEEPPPPTAIPTAEELRIPRNVHFALAQDVVTPVSRDVIAGITEVLKKYPSITVRLVGHTDSRGSAAYNLDLSRRRVEAVRAVFAEMGIEDARLTVDYKGKSELYSVEDTRRGFALNRRVEMVFVDAEGRDIRGESQEQDLQLERERSQRNPAPAPQAPESPDPQAPETPSTPDTSSTQP